MPFEIKKGSKLQNDRYVISDYLGSGGFGIVWRATDTKEGRDVAIKRMIKQNGDENKRLLDEARKISALKGHKNIVEVYEVFELDGEGFLVMEHVDGDLLETICKKHVQNRTWLDQEEALDYLKQSLHGLLFAHSSGLFHRDIKPANILVSKLGVVKLVDFGLARKMNEPVRVGELGFAWTGTPNFMSPEQAGGGELDHQTDIFSAGILAYILLTGRHPFNHPSAIASVFDLIKEPLFECEDITRHALKPLPDGVTKTIMRMLRKDKTQRSQSLMEPLSELTKEPAQSCTSCGAPNPVGNNFCGQCGGGLKVPNTTTLTTTSTTTPATTSTTTPSKQSAAELTDEGFALAQSDDWGGAVSKYQEAIQADANYVRAYSNLGYALNTLGRYQEAIGVLTDAIELTQEKSILHRVYDYRGFSKSNLKDYGGAIDDFSRSIGYSAYNPRVYYHRAESKALAGVFEESYADVLQALKLDPTYPSALRLKQRLEVQALVKLPGHA